ncbi:MAG TPA: hypothetical protein VK063_00840 [Beutenbergiaceae bacterium]|nr:hypothetical protein [Beutenbergiaceae bacterium]
MIAGDRMTAGTAVVPPAEDFDLREFLDEPRPVHLADDEHADLQARHLPPGVLAVLEHMRRTEHSLLDWMRDVLITPTQVEADVTAFLTTWAYEKYWLGQTLQRLLLAHPAVPVPPPGRWARISDELHERMWPVVGTIGTNLAGPAVTAGHLARALADTLAQRVTAIRLAQVSPALEGLSGSILHTTERHVAFFQSQLRARSRHRSARVVIGQSLRWWRWPGARRGDERHLGAALRYLLGHPRTRDLVARADAALGALPGAPARAVLRTEFARIVVHGTTGSQLRVQ